ncbi:MAG: hypothetical protein IKQ69_06950 [Oscillospiraceae bacterium]|nr:hypothetical protein [Oscillospiraceae bacterium]
MKVRGSNLSMTRGDSESITVKCFQSGAAVPFENGDTVTFTVREDVESPIALQKGVTAFDENGWAVIGILPGDTESMDFGSYVYDIQLTRADGTVTTLITISDFELTEEVTY